MLGLCGFWGYYLPQMVYGPKATVLESGAGISLSGIGNVGKRAALRAAIALNDGLQEKDRFALQVVSDGSEKQRGCARGRTAEEEFFRPSCWSAEQTGCSPRSILVRILIRTHEPLREELRKRRLLKQCSERRLLSKIPASIRA